MSSGGSGGGAKVSNPARWSSANEGAFIGAIRGYAGVNSPQGEDLSFDQFLEQVDLTVDDDGHPLFRPFMIRRYGAYAGLAEENPLAYDHPTARYKAFQQLEEGMRVAAYGEYALIDELYLEVGDTVAVENISTGIRRLFLVEGISEDENGIVAQIVDVLGS